MGSIWARYRRLGWWRQALVVSVALFIGLAVIGALTAPSTTTATAHAGGTSTSRAEPRTSTTAERQDAAATTTTGVVDSDGGDSAGNAPTIMGAPVAAGSGSVPGSTACRAGDPLANVYHPDRLTVLSPCKTVTGTVRSVRHESDGDYHIALEVDA